MVLRRGLANVLLLIAVSGCAHSRRQPVVSAEPASTCDQPNVVCAWWLTATFIPADTVIQGLRVSQIRREWERATVLTLGKLPRAARADMSMLADSTGRFSVDGDFNGDGIIDRAVVGVYRSRSGETGRFLLVMTPARVEHPKVAFVALQPGMPGFSVLTYREGRLTWGACMECDDFSFVRWDGKRYVLKYALDPDS